MLNSLDWNDQLAIPRDLNCLIRYQISGDNFLWEKIQELDDKRGHAFHVALLLALKGINPTYRAVGKELGISATTVMRWFPNKDPNKGYFDDLKKMATEIREHSERD